MSGDEDRARIARIWRDRLGSIEDGYSPSYNSERRVDERLLARALERLPRPGRALDVGSFYPETPRQRARRGWTVVCADIVFDCCQRARDVGAAEGVRLLAVQCDAFALPFRPGTFDLVTDLATSVVTRDGGRVIAGEADLVRPGGAYVLVSNNSWTRSGAQHLKRVREERGKHSRWGYFSPVSPLELLRIARRHRLRMVSIDSEAHSREATGLIRYVLGRLVPVVRLILGWRIGAVYLK